MIFIIIDKFTKQRYFIVYIKEISVKGVVQVYIKEVFIKYKALDKIISNKNIRFIAAF